MRAMRRQPPPGQSVWVPSSIPDHANVLHFSDFHRGLTVCRPMTLADAAQQKAAVAFDVTLVGDAPAATVEQAHALAHGEVEEATAAAVVDVKATVARVAAGGADPAEFPQLARINGECKHSRSPAAGGSSRGGP